jgi:hypothetical protein
MAVIDLAEARKAKRRAVLEMGLIRFGDMSMCCVLRNLSEAGAALDVGPQRGIPDQFTLVAFPNKKIYSCNVVWRERRRIGVAFTDTSILRNYRDAPKGRALGMKRHLAVVR